MIKAVQGWDYKGFIYKNEAEAIKAEQYDKLTDALIPILRKEYNDGYNDPSNQITYFIDKNRELLKRIL